MKDIVGFGYCGRLPRNVVAINCLENETTKSQLVCDPRVHFNLPQEKCFAIVLYLSTRMSPLIQSVYEHEKSKEDPDRLRMKDFGSNIVSLSFIKIRSDGMPTEATFSALSKGQIYQEAFSRIESLVTRNEFSS